MTDKEQKKNKAPRGNLIGVIGLGTLFGVLVITILTPQIQQLQLNRESLLETEAQIAILQSAVNDRVDTQEDFLELDDTSILQESLLPEDEVIQFVEEIESAATKAGVSHIVRLQTEKRVELEAYVTIPITIQATGDWDGVVLFVSELEQFDWYINTTSVGISSAALNTSDQDILIEANSYWTKP